MKRKHYPTVFSIAGSDPSGGAGIQADIKTCSALGVYAMAAVTAVTAQNTLGVHGFEAVSPEIMRAQLDAVLSDITPDAIKIGMLPNATIANIVADSLERYNCHNVVTDPVIVASSGHSLTDGSVKEVLQSRIFPLSEVITPNIPEAKIFGSTKISVLHDLPEAARHLLHLHHPHAVLLKGGHLNATEELCDTLIRRGSPDFLQFKNKKIATLNTHGTGCSLSSAIAAFLAQGLSLEMAVGYAIEWEHQAIIHGADFEFGHGHGPVNHLFKFI